MNNNQPNVKEFVFEGKSYKIDCSQKVRTIGDFDEKTGTVYIDKDVPEKFHEGVALHEIVERKLIKRGHSYQYAHNEAQKRELAFYEEKYGKEEGLKLLTEEEALVYSKTSYKLLKRTKDIVTGPAPKIETKFVRVIVYEGKQYLVDNSNSLIGDIADFYEKHHIIYFDKDVPERFFEGMAIYVIEERKMLKQGYSYAAAREEALKKELAYYEEKFGHEEALKIMEEELKLQSKRFASIKKEIGPEGEHKVVYDEVPK